MNIKTIIQILMFLLIILISSSLYLKYFNKIPEKIEKNKITKKINLNDNVSSTYIDDIDYVSFDIKGNKYQITATRAEIDKDNSNLMFLRDVVAYIFVKNTGTIKVTSDFGKYDSENHDTIFSKNVTIVHPSHKITAEYLDFSFLNNLGTISANVVYTSNETNFFADKLEMNLANKDVKISMNDNSKKVLIEVSK
mgnify:CR=1 FL=1|tara:strand:+ start:1258 stop:1842 length:585 start_codon:yes stop_codon:yes gene_type:complete